MNFGTIPKNGHKLQAVLTNITKIQKCDQYYFLLIQYWTLFNQNTWISTMDLERLHLLYPIGKKKLIINQKLKFLEIKQRISIAWEQQKRLLKYQLQRSIQRNFYVSSMHFKNACHNIKHRVAKIYDKVERQLKILIFP